jgi:mRNA-degrading endonuclease RelE of RelBE toxin-antitoxin system
VFNFQFKEKAAKEINKLSPQVRRRIKDSREVKILFFAKQSL